MVGFVPHSHHHHYDSYQPSYPTYLPNQPRLPKVIDFNFDCASGANYCLPDPPGSCLYAQVQTNVRVRIFFANSWGNKTRKNVNFFRICEKIRNEILQERVLPPRPQAWEHSLFFSGPRQDCWLWYHVFKIVNFGNSYFKIVFLVVLFLSPLSL